MIEATIQVNEAEIKRRLGSLENLSGKVIARAVNRSYPTGKKAIAKGATEEYRITQKDVNSALKITNAKQSNPTATLKYTGGHRNIYLWNNKKAVSPNLIIRWKHGKPNVKRYKAAVKRGGAKKRLNGEGGPGDNKPFIQRVREGEKSEFTGLFRRKTTDRESKLVAVHAPAIPQILKNEEIMVNFSCSAGPMLQKRLEHEIDAILKGVTT